MWLDAIALLILGLFMGMGAMRGGLASALGLVSLGAAYGAAIWAAPRFAEQAAAGTGAPVWLGMPIAGTLAFLITFALMGLVSFGLKRLDRAGREGSRSPRDRFVGASFGAARGALVVLLLSYLALWVDALRTTGTVEGLPELGDSAAASVTESVVEAGVQAAFGDGQTGQMMARVAARPNAAIADIQSVVQHPAIAGLQSDPMFWTYVESGSIDAALNRGSFIRLARDDSLRERLAQLGIVGTDAASDSRAFREAARDVLREVGPRLRQVRHDPALQELMEDPEVVAAVQTGNHLALMTDPRFRDMVSRVMEDGQ
ncbi:MAG: CvpA family protein [Myxococcota bacterium]|nr:CvpA family protein [Myxococcota bacterium]